MSGNGEKSESEMTLEFAYERLDQAWENFQEHKDTPDAAEYLARIVGVAGMAIGILWNDPPSKVLTELGAMMMLSEMTVAVLVSDEESEAEEAEG